MAERLSQSGSAIGSSGVGLGFGGKWGSRGDESGLGFVFKAGVMGIDGDERRKSFKNGDRGRGRGDTGIDDIGNEVILLESSGADPSPRAMSVVRGRVTGLGSGWRSMIRMPWTA